MGNISDQERNGMRTNVCIIFNRAADGKLAVVTNRNLRHSLRHY